MTPEKLERLKQLQEFERRHGRLSHENAAELEQLRTELAREQQELPDDPNTLLTDESRRPLLDGGDYLEQQKQRDCDEARAWLEAFALRVGRAAAEAAVSAALASIRR